MIPTPRMRDRVQVQCADRGVVEAHVVGHCAPDGVELVDLMLVPSREILLNVPASQVIAIIERSALKLAEGKRRQ